MLRVLILLFLSLIINSYAAVYIFPPDYDDIKSSVQNGNTVSTITETSALSVNTYKVATGSGVHTVRYRCASIPKISCSTGNIDIYASPVAVQLIRRVNGTQLSGIGVSSWQIVAEDNGSLFNICVFFFSDDGNTYFTSWDESTIDTNVDPKDGSSYVVLNVRQVCR